MSANDHDRPIVSAAPEKVGRGHPPREHRFKPGQSGNPKGRRKGCKNEATLLRDLLDDTKLSLRVGGKTKKISVREAILRRMIEDAMKGDIKSAQFLLNRHRALVEGEAVPPELSPDDAEILQDYVQRHAASETGRE
jgi:hypothetical protein